MPATQQQQLPPEIQNKPCNICHQRLLPTPINISTLRMNLEDYDPALTAYLINGFTEGFDIGSNADVIHTQPTNSKSTNDYHHFVKEKLQSEINAGRIAGPFTSPPFSTFQISPLAVRPKKTPGKFRLLQDLSHPYNETSINHNIPANKRNVQYSSVGEAIKKIQSFPRGSLAA